MYAIIQTGGKQYRVSKGDIIDVELLKEESKVSFKEVVLLQDGKKVEVERLTFKDASLKPRSLIK